MSLLTHNLFGLKTKAFGLEIENSSLKAVWIEKKRGIFRLVSCGRKILPRGIVQAEQIINPQKLAQEIKDLLAKAQPISIKTKNVVFSIPETKAFIRTIQIPKMTDKEAREAVKWETEANIPISLDKVYLDWQVIGSKENTEDVLVVAVPKSVVDSYSQAVVLAGLTPLAVEIDIVATIRSLSDIENNRQPVLIADIGAENTSIAICQNQIPYFTSSIPLSGKSFTEALQKEIGVSWEKAEKIKFKFGLGNMADQDMLFKIFNPLIENLASEIEKSINFYNESINSSEKVDKVILSGGGALLNEFPKYLGDRLKKEIVMGNPTMNINIKNFPYKISARDLLSYSTVIGLALRGADYED
ncbi:MAG: type IV pilus assembly protein PilM [Parcubacteria group bacterium]|jgi:type IV pilus assembly protein PilM